jgi:hypothetical protein
VKHIATAAVILALPALSLKAEARNICPTAREFGPIALCLAHAENLAQVNYCTGRWDGDRLWNCIRDNPALKRVYSDALAGGRPRSCRSTTARRPDLLRPDRLRVAQAITNSSPGAEPAVKFRAYQMLMATYGCGSAPVPAAPTLPEITDCRWIGGSLSCLRF